MMFFFIDFFPFSFHGFIFFPCPPLHNSPSFPLFQYVFLLFLFSLFSFLLFLIPFPFPLFVTLFPFPFSRYIVIIFLVFVWILSVYKLTRYGCSVCFCLFFIVVFHECIFLSSICLGAALMFFSTWCECLCVYFCVCFDSLLLDYFCSFIASLFLTSPCVRFLFNWCATVRVAEDSCVQFDLVWLFCRCFSFFPNAIFIRA